MGVEESGEVVEGFLKYVSNYNREFYKTGPVLVGGLCYFEQDEEVQVLDEVHLKKNLLERGSKFQHLNQIN